MDSSDEKNVESEQRVSAYSILWYVGVILLSVLSIVSMLLISPTSFPLVIVRWVTGLTMLFWVPGFSFVKALFSGKTIGSVETVTFSVALSILLVIVIALVCNFTPLGLSEMPIIAILSAISVALASVAIYYQNKYFANESISSPSKEIEPVLFRKLPENENKSTDALATDQKQETTGVKDTMEKLKNLEDERKTLLLELEELKTTAGSKVTALENEVDTLRKKLSRKKSDPKTGKDETDGRR